MSLYVVQSFVMYSCNFECGEDSDLFYVLSLRALVRGWCTTLAASRGDPAGPYFERARDLLLNAVLALPTEARW